MHQVQGAKAGRNGKVCLWAEAVPDMRDIHKVGGPLVPVLRVPPAHKASQPKVQGKAQGARRGRLEGRRVGIEKVGGCALAGRPGSPDGRSDPAAASPGSPSPAGQPYAARTVSAGGRTYHVAAVRFANGDFVSVTEGAPPPAAGIGAMAVSISTPGLPPATTMVIPSKHDGLFMRLAAEQVGHLNGGISVVSCSSKEPLGADGARAVMAAVSDMVRRNA